MEYYIIFALTTALACCYEFFWPCIQEAKTLGVDNEFTRHPLLSCIIYTCVSTIIAPLLIIPFLSTTKSEKFRQGLRNTIVKND
jgi:hypothetical protein